MFGCFYEVCINNKAYEGKLDPCADPRAGPVFGTNRVVLECLNPHLPLTRLLSQVVTRDTWHSKERVKKRRKCFNSYQKTGI